MAKVVVIGSCMIDLTCFTPRLPKAGETIHGSSFKRDFGGKGANQCVAALRLGAQTALVACLGDDIFGKEYFDYLQRSGVDTKHVSVKSGESSGIAQISVADNGENHIIIVGGVNNALRSHEIDVAAQLISNAAVLVFQFETPICTTIHALKMYKKNNPKGRTIVNAAPASDSVDKELYKYTDILCVNEIEAQLMSGLPTSTRAECELALKHLISFGCSCVIITLGRDGAIFTSRENLQIHYEPGSPDSNPVDTTGAGDAFIGALAFLLAYRSHWSLSRQIQVSCQVAAFSVHIRGTQSSFPYAEQLPNHLLSD